MNQVETALRRQLLDARNNDGGWGYEASRASRLEPTCWALLALRRSAGGIGSSSGRVANSERRSSRASRQGFRTGRSMRLHLRRGWRWATRRSPTCNGSRTHSSEARGLTFEARLRFSVRTTVLQGWSWIDGTFSWVEPTAWAPAWAQEVPRAGHGAARAPDTAHPRWRICPAGSCLRRRRLELRKLQRLRQGPTRVHPHDSDRVAGAAGSCRMRPS